MTSQERLEMAARLEEAVLRIPGIPTNAEEMFERYETTAISVLDSEHANYGEEVLCGFLSDYLSAKRQELGLEPSP